MKNKVLYIKKARSLCDYCNKYFYKGVIVCPNFCGSMCSRCLRKNIKIWQKLLDSVYET